MNDHESRQINMAAARQLPRGILKSQAWAAGSRGTTGRPKLTFRVKTSQETGDLRDVVCEIKYSNEVYKR